MLKVFTEFKDYFHFIKKIVFESQKSNVYELPPTIPDFIQYKISKI
jgi:hypothetical protein